MAEIDLRPSLELAAQLSRQVAQGEAALEKEKETPEVFDLGGLPVVKHEFKRFKQPEPDPIGVTTLSGLVAYVNGNPDELDLAKCMLHVESPTLVTLRSVLTGPYLQRPVYIQAKASTLPEIMFGRFLEVERFNIMLLSAFTDSDHRKALLAVTGNVVAGTSIETADDGVTQVATLKTGIQRKEKAELPSPVVLAPFRTFPEVAQPESAFLLRGKQGDVGGDIEPFYALFEADGGAWRGAAMASIKAYLEEHQSAVKVVA